VTGADDEIHYDWRHFAACLAEDPELFFPVGNGHEAQIQATVAKRICHDECPEWVRAKCLHFALEPGTRQDAGVWGGMDEEERRALIRRRNRARRAVA
jgi:WhiB family redox-sensing transcriptional regulator